MMPIPLRVAALPGAVLVPNVQLEEYRPGQGRPPLILR
jgi:hypothetical protein